MSENLECPYCGSIVQVDGSHVSYDDKVTLRCPNCGGQFEYMGGFGAFSIPGEGPRMKPRVTYEGSYPGEIYEGSTPWDSESPPKQQSSCGTCCAIICCLMGISIIFPLIMFFGGLLWLFG